MIVLWVTEEKKVRGTEGPCLKASVKLSNRCNLAAAGWVAAKQLIDCLYWLLDLYNYC